MKNSVLMRSINTLNFRQNKSLILKLTSGQRKKYLIKLISNPIILKAAAEVIITYHLLRSPEHKCTQMLSTP
jgi:hypothetical protein